VPHFWPILPEVEFFRQNSPRKPKFQRTNRTRNIPHQRLGHEQVYMLRHDDKSDHTEPIPISHLLQNLKQKIAALGCAQQRLAIAATPGDEV
jgi:hypothetical protein